MARGFTLFELLVVLAIMGLIAGLAVPQFSRGRPGAELQRATRDLVANLREARGQAIAGNRNVAVLLDSDNGGYRIGDERRRLPPGSSLRFDPAGSPGFPGEMAAGLIRFFPDGSSDGGRLVLGWGTARRDVEVNWLTGRIEILEPENVD